MVPERNHRITPNQERTPLSGQLGHPTRPITSFKTAWIKVRQKAGVKGRWHDNRHTLVTEFAESGAGDEVIMSIAGHVSRAMKTGRNSGSCEFPNQVLEPYPPGIRRKRNIPVIVELPIRAEAREEARIDCAPIGGQTRHRHCGPRPLITGVKIATTSP